MKERKLYIQHDMKQYWYQAWYVLFQQPCSLLLTQHKTGLLSCLIWTVETALFTPVGSSALNSAVRTGLNSTVDNNVHRVQHNTVHACFEQYCSGMLTTCSTLCVFTCVHQFYPRHKTDKDKNFLVKKMTTFQYRVYCIIL